MTIYSWELITRKNRLLPLQFFSSSAHEQNCPRFLPIILNIALIWPF
jgi:hypothetical protein